MTPEIPESIAAAATSACLAEFPNRTIARHICLSAVDSKCFVLLLYLPVADLTPPPYVIYEVNRESLVARRLTGEEGKPHQIKNYK